MGRSLRDEVVVVTGASAGGDVPRLRPRDPDILFEPAAGDGGAHGSFDAVAKRTSVAWWLSKNRAALAGATVAVAASGFVLRTLARRGDR